MLKTKCCNLPIKRYHKGGYPFCDGCLKTLADLNEEDSIMAKFKLSLRNATPLETLEARVDALTKSFTVVAIVQAVCAVGLLIHVII